MKWYVSATSKTSQRFTRAFKQLSFLNRATYNVRDIPDILLKLEKTAYKSSWKVKIIGQRNNSTEATKAYLTHTYDLKFKTLVSHMCLCLWSLGLLAVLKPVCVCKRKRGCDPQLQGEPLLKKKCASTTTNNNIEGERGIKWKRRNIGRQRGHRTI